MGAQGALERGCGGHWWGRLVLWSGGFLSGGILERRGGFTVWFLIGRGYCTGGFAGGA